jgi:hypothetical protein
VRPAASHSGHVHRSRIKCTAVSRPVSARDGDAGSRPSGRATPTTARTRPGRSERGHKCIATTGASIGAHIRNTARTIAGGRLEWPCGVDAQSGVERKTCSIAIERLRLVTQPGPRADTLLNRLVYCAPELSIIPVSTLRDVRSTTPELKRRCTLAEQRPRVCARGRDEFFLYH